MCIRDRDYDTEHFDVIQVPSVWQMAGYDVHQYTNIRYPFPFDPPYVPQDIPGGAYVHTFDYSLSLIHIFLIMPAITISRRNFLIQDFS